MLEIKGWLVIRISCNALQSGLPDLYVTHARYGGRWVEVKNPLSFSFTPAQIEVFPKLVQNGTPVFVLIDGTQAEYEKLFKPCNYMEYMAKQLIG